MKEEKHLQSFQFKKRKKEEILNLTRQQRLHEQSYLTFL